ncbi:lipopolysaccharide assembly protein LapA domain-containing protein [Paenibacillus pasadenensis]|uniref:LapA family protein n=1 Tax=Paenibacillus pasadenensis TaxID=217090 RepID=UPI0020413B0F|nr:lipopolysaccharide assembly protein LapA domain-containing protein [Paenibacillus pasadenensis]MCM3748397.1 lipopolysaccharide assembly protein LapA domain-containing protein [Paenibacillus pasadenensis]
MKTQGLLISGLIFALIIAIFAVINVDPVQVNFLFAQTNSPLILVILGSALLGGLSVGLLGIIRSYRLNRQLKALQRELNELKSKPLGYTKEPVVLQETGPGAEPAAVPVRHSAE